MALLSQSPRRTLLLLTIALSSTACGGSAETSDRANTNASGGNGPSATDSSGGQSGVDTPLDRVDKPCVEDSDCVLAAFTNQACYSPGCSAPSVTTTARADSDPCVIPWEGDVGPSTPEQCRPDNGDSICGDVCFGPSVCAAAVCEDGQCRGKYSNDPADCADCEALDRAREEALNAARACDPDIDLAGQCYASLPDECGCPQPATSQSEELLQTALDAHTSWSTVCERPESCQPCATPPPTLPSCAGDNREGGSICSY